MELRWSYDGTSMGLRRIWVFFRYLPAIATARPSAVLCPVPVSGILSPMAASVLGVLGYGPGRIDFPAAAQGFVDGDEAGGGAGFALGQLGLDRELGALGIEHGQEIVHTALVTLAGQCHGLSRRTVGLSQVIAADLLAPEIEQGVLGFR